ATPLWEPCPWAKGLFPGRALHAVRSGGAAPTPLCGSSARGGKGGSLGVLCTPFAAGALLLHPSVGALPVGERAVPVGVLCTPFAARALLLQTFVGAPPSGRMARSARPLSCA